MKDMIKIYEEDNIPGYLNEEDQSPSWRIKYKSKHLWDKWIGKEF